MIGKELDGSVEPGRFLTSEVDLGGIHLGCLRCLGAHDLDEVFDDALGTGVENDGLVGGAPHPATLGPDGRYGALEGLDVNLELEGRRAELGFPVNEEGRDLARLDDRGRLVVRQEGRAVLDYLDTDARGVREGARVGLNGNGVCISSSFLHACA